MREEPTERGGAVTSQSPEDTAGSYRAANACDETRDKGQKQEANGASLSPSGLAIDFGEGKEEGAVENSIQVINAVKDGNKVEKAAQKTEYELRKNGLGNVDTRTGRLN